jgi:hypothetical protein
MNNIEAMEKYGGSFVKSLANAWYHADPINKKKLEDTFHYFEEYKKYEE